MSLPTCYSSGSPGAPENREAGRHVCRLAPLVKKASEHEQHVGWSFAETSHEVGKPGVTEGQVDVNSMSLVDQTCLKIATYPMEHLEREGVTPSAELFRVAPRGFDHARVVRGEGRVVC